MLEGLLPLDEDCFLQPLEDDFGQFHINSDLVCDQVEVPDLVLPAVYWNV